MARRTKLQTFEIEVEEALAKAMDSDFNDTLSETISLSDSKNVINVDELVQKITMPEEDIFTENDVSTPTLQIENKTVANESDSGKPFTQKHETDLSGGTVHSTLLSKQLLAANDDTTLPINFELSQQNSISRIYWSTTALSALWAVGGIFIAHKLAPAGLSSLSNFSSFFTSPTGLAVAIGTAVPIFISWGFSQLTKRSNELHNIAILMANAAQRLSEPQIISEKQTVAIGQAVRKEVAAMNEGIERTLKRAVELEAIIQGEVHSLEQAYAENESRMHALIKELSNERMAILNHADRVQSTIKGTQEQLSDEFGLVTSQIATNVGKLAKTLSQTLQAQGEDLVAKLSCAGDGVTNDLFEKFNKTTAQIQQKNTEFFYDLEKKVNNFSEHLGNNEKKIERTFSETAVKAEMQIAKIATHIQAATDQTLHNVDEKFKTLDKRIIDLNNQSLQKLDDKIEQLGKRAYKLSSKFDDITSEAIKAFESRLATVDLSLREHSESIIESFINRSQDLKENAEKLGNFLESHTLQINKSLRERTSDINDAFTNGRDNILSAIDKSKEILREEIKNVDNAIVDIVQERSRDFKSQFADQRAMIANVLDEGKNKIADTLSNQIDILAQNTSNIENVLIGNVQIFDKHADNHVTSIVQCTEKLQEIIAKSCNTTKDALEAQARNIDIRADALRDSLAINSFSLNEVLADQARTLEQRMETIHNLIEKSDIRVDVALRQQIDLVENAIVSNHKNITETVRGHIKNLEGHTEVLKDTLFQSHDTFFGALGKHMESFDKNLEIRAHKIFECASTLEETLSEKLDRVCEAVKTQTSILEERSDALQTSIIFNNEQSQAVQYALESSVDNIRTTLEDSVNTVTSDLHNKIVEASDALSSRGEQIISSVAHIAEKAEDIIAESGNRIVSNVKQTVYETSEKVLSVLSEQTAHTAEAFTMAGHNAQTLLNETILTSATAIEQVLSERCNILHHSMEDLKNNLGYQISEVSNRLEEAKSQTENKISEHVKKLTELTNSLNQTAQNTTESINYLTQHVSEQLSLSTQNAEQRIHEHNKSLVNALEQANSETIQAVMTVKENLVNDVSSTLKKLNQSIYNIHDSSNILISAVQNIEGHFDKTTNNFLHNTNRMAESLSSSSQTLDNNVEILQGLSKNTFEKIGHITSNFGEHVKTLSETVHVLSQSENTLSVTLEEKHKVLSALSDDLVLKTEKINQLVGYYENILNIVSERTDENVRNSAHSFQQSLNHVIQEASTRFAEAAEDIRRSADEIRSEFSKINNDINENIQKFPEKTRETTKAICNTTNEQIAPLEDFSNIAQERENNKQILRNKFVPDVFSSPIPNRKYSTVHEKAKKIVPPKPSLQQEQSKKRQNKWVSNLLKRVSREEELYEEPINDPIFSSAQTKTRPTGGSLSSFAISILQAINHDAVVELWNHYRRGQINIVEEQLYTSNGKIIFEKIRKKYACDVDFKRSVDMYIVDFEKLLHDVSRNSGDISSIRKYLISNTGKVYTMLAHASGRIQ
ncbi:hypothetical protein [Bartonella sp. B41]